MKLETKIKKWTLGDWKNEAWKWCSIFNRRKDTDWKGNGKCCTCGKELHWTDGDAGHFQSGRGLSILFHDKGIHLQCKQCNGPGSGEQYRYGLFIEKRYGKDEVIKQQQMKRQTRKYTRQEYIDLIDFYQKQIEKYG